MSIYEEVTNPDLLAELNFNAVSLEPTDNKEVTDPKLLAKLNFGDATEETVIDPTSTAEDPNTWADWIAPVLEVGSEPQQPLCLPVNLQVKALKH